MRAYKIAIGVILFQFSIPVAAAIGFVGPLSGSTSTIGLVGKALSSPKTWISIGIDLLAIGVTSQIFGLRTNLGALIFAGIFTIGNIPIGGTMTKLNSVNLMFPELEALLLTGMHIVFLFGFIQLASTPAKGAH